MIEDRREGERERGRVQGTSSRMEKYEHNAQLLRNRIGGQSSLTVTRHLTRVHDRMDSGR